MGRIVKRTLAYLLAFSLIAQMCLITPLFDANVVEAATTLPTINEAVVAARISELARILEINEGNLNEGVGIQFTVNEGACPSGHPTNSANGCTNCKNSYVVQSAKFKQRFGYNVDTGLLTRHYYPSGEKGGHIGWTCHGFAAFALWYIGKEDTSTNVSANLVGEAGAAFTYENLVKFGISIGDVIRVDGHSMMFLGYNGTSGIKVLDCNWVNHVVSDVATVKIHSNQKFTGSAMAISRVTNYVPDGSMPSNTIDENVVAARIRELARILEINEGNLNEGIGIQFTANGGACPSGHATNNADGCTNCKNTSVVQSEMFRQRFGYNADYRLFTRHYYPSGEKGSHIGWTCHGFAAFALWYIGKDSLTTDVVAGLVGEAGAAFTYENLVKYGISIGDVIRVDNHSMMFLGYNGTTGIKVLDCNWVNGSVADVATVKIHSNKTFTGSPMAISRVTNYVPKGIVVDTSAPVINNVSITQDGTGYTITCTATDNIGVTKVAFPTWTEYNGQDDLVLDWYNTQLGVQNGNTYTFQVFDHLHNLERGNYITHIYAYDAAGNYTMKDVVVNVQNAYKPSREVVYKNSKYMVFEDLLTWSEAQKKCEELGGHLAVITSQGEQDTIANLIDGRAPWRGGFYLGGTLSNKQLSWVTGEAVSYSKWCDGQPDNANNAEPCLMIFTNDKTWNDAIVSGSSLGFICEIEYPITLNTTNVALDKNGTYTLKLNNANSQLTVNDVVWTSSDTSVATVSAGKVTALKSGTATITAKYGSKTATCKVTVKGTAIPDGLNSQGGKLYYYKNGVVDTSYTGLASNSDGIWYVSNGIVNTSITALVRDDSNNWWYIAKGKVDLSYTGLFKYNDIWWYIVNGKLASSYKGMVQNGGSWWYVTNGKIATDYKGVVSNAGYDWYVVNGKIDTGFKGLALNNGIWYCVHNGKINMSYTGLIENGGSWWYVVNGVLDTTKTGIVETGGSQWLVGTGKLQSNYSGTYKYNGVNYKIVNGKVVN